MKRFMAKLVCCFSPSPSLDILAGYYMATLDAALHYITRFADDYNASLAKTASSTSNSDDPQSTVNEV